MSARYLIILRIHNEAQIFRRTWFLFVAQNKLNVLEVDLPESLSLVLGASSLQAAPWALLKLVLDGFNSPEEVCELDSSLDLQINTNGENLFLTYGILNEPNNFLSSMIVGLKDMIIWYFMVSNFPVRSLSQAPYWTINHFQFYVPVKRKNPAVQSYGEIPLGWTLALTNISVCKCVAWLFFEDVTHWKKSNENVIALVINF